MGAGARWLCAYLCGGGAQVVGLGLAAAEPKGVMARGTAVLVPGASIVGTVAGAAAAEAAVVVPHWHDGRVFVGQAAGIARRSVARRCVVSRCASFEPPESTAWC